MSSTPALTATYSAPFTGPKSFTQSLPACSEEPSTIERTASLTALRTAITTTQDQINAFLTHKMEEDNQKAGAAAAVDDAKAEENYGEEAAEDDA